MPPSSELKDFWTPVFTGVTNRGAFARGGIILTPSRAIGDVENPDLILLPAFFPPFDMQNKRIKAICRWIRESYQRGREIACTCTGTYLLAETGLLDGRTATTKWLFADSFKRQYPKVNLRIERIFIEDSGLYCTGAATAFMNLCLHLFEKFGSSDLASLCAKALLVDTDRHTQSPYAINDFRKNHADNQILKAQKWMGNNFESKFSIDAVAASIGISSRHFKCRFKTAAGDTPLADLQHLRIVNAKRFLDRTQDSVNEIKWKVGYEDINSFRRLFIKHTGLSPKHYRNKFLRQSGDAC